MKARTKEAKGAGVSHSGAGTIQELCVLASKESGNRLKACIVEPLIEELPVGVAMVNSHGRFTVFNREAKRIMGMGPQDGSCATWAETYGCYLPDKVTLYAADRMPLARALAGETVTDELMFIRNRFQPQGVWIRANCSPVSHVGAEHGWAVAVFTDETERRKTTERVELLSRAVAQTADSVVITDRAARIQYVNAAFELTTGYTREEAIGNTPRMLKSGAHDEEFYRGLWATILAGKPYRGTLQNRKKSGELYWAEQTIDSITDAAGEITHFVSVLKDITESRKQQEHQIQMQLARGVQQRFYANAVPVAGLDVGTAVHPAEQTGGDYVDFVRTSDESLGIAIGDVSGHGFAAALIMAVTRAYTRSFFAQGLGVAKVLHAVNQMLRSDLEEIQYVTLLLVHIDVADAVLSYASAGHSPGFVLNRFGEVQARLQSTGIPLGVLPDHRTATKLVPLESGQIIILLTDGVIESGEPMEFGAERVIAYVRQHQSEPAQQIADGIYRTARAHTGDEPQRDDISVVIVKRE